MELDSLYVCVATDCQDSIVDTYKKSHEHQIIGHKVISFDHFYNKYGHLVSDEVISKFTVFRQEMEIVKAKLVIQFQSLIEEYSIKQNICLFKYEDLFDLELKKIIDQWQINDVEELTRSQQKIKQIWNQGPSNVYGKFESRTQKVQQINKIMEKELSRNLREIDLDYNMIFPQINDFHSFFIGQGMQINQFVSPSYIRHGRDGHQLFRLAQPISENYNFQKFGFKCPTLKQSDPIFFGLCALDEGENKQKQKQGLPSRKGAFSNEQTYLVDNLGRIFLNINESYKVQFHVEQNTEIFFYYDFPKRILKFKNNNTLEQGQFEIPNNHKQLYPCVITTKSGQEVQIIQPINIPDFK